MKFQGKYWQVWFCLSLAIIFPAGWALACSAPTNPRTVSFSVFCNGATTIYVNIVNPNANASSPTQCVQVTYTATQSGTNSVSNYTFAKSPHTGPGATTGALAITSINAAKTMAQTSWTDLTPGQGMQAAVAVNGTDVYGTSSCYISVAVGSTGQGGYVVANGLLGIGGQWTPLDFNGNRPF